MAPGSENEGVGMSGAKAQSDWIVEGIELVDGTTGTRQLSELQPRWDVPDTVAVTADLAHRCRPEGVIDEALACIDAGASALHVHVSDDSGFSGDLETWEHVVTEIRAEEPDVVIDVGPHGDTFEERTALIRSGFADVVTVLPSFDPEYGRRLVSVMDEEGVVPAFRTAGGSVTRARAHYLDRIAAPDPVLWVVGSGNPYWHVPHNDPFAMVSDLILRLRAIEDVDPDGRVTAIAGGRASVFLAAQAMLFGCDVRGGVAETSWRYPHSDLEIEHTHQMVEDVVAVAKGIGREPLTPAEYRAELDLDR